MPTGGLNGPGSQPVFDVFLAGTVFLDMVFTGLSAMPSAGTEVWADGMGSCPGGIANLAIATSRLGLHTSLATAFGDDLYGDFCARTLSEQEGVDLSRSRRCEGWHSPVTVSLAVDRDRSMVTHEHESPVTLDEMVGRPPRSRAVVLDLGSQADSAGAPSWARLAHQDGALVFADAGWDPTGTWSRNLPEQLAIAHAFTPNAREAMAYTRRGTPKEALHALAELVPLAVVTDGRDGALAIDGTTGEQAQVPAPPVQALDPTGAGDVFAAGLVLGTLRSWPLADRLAFAGLCAALAVQQFGGSLAAPGWGDIADWWRALQVRADRAGDDMSLELAARYAFLEQVLPPGPVSGVRRASATIARRADVAGTAREEVPT